MGAQAELQKLLYDTLRASTAIMALAGGVYDRVPADPYKDKTAYISFGPADVVDDGADCSVSGTHSFQLDVWSKAVGQVEAKNIVDLIYRTLHEAELALSVNALAEIRVDFRRVFTDSDGLTTHGVASVTASIEEPE
ncbi:DUF3168 domain-containing protein [Rhizobium ruizarguesonis]|uniref:DUF3168 domain-containing protein n=1 Tax=Rhizobium ruizarguesonis TaxID=2081791 RepID=UPI00103150BB|nr:DUF3168 domain-containing protein [Rhizobium ruizarguesonis]TBC01425.1 DUF3168 domain-containing protein [Rhizobium ruizarguesonis]TBC36410.1 DUF3168 domain-containing protein [Rhizobium ruizarguesonis]